MSLQRALENKSENIFIPSLHSVKRWSKVLNIELFGGKLEPFLIDIRQRRKKRWAFYHEKCMYMNTWYGSKKHFIEVLAHEMVHHYQLLNNEPLGHGPSFNRWKRKFKKKGLTLKRAY